MLDQVTAVPAVASAESDPGSRLACAALLVAADLLWSLRGLPEATVTAWVRGIGIQFSHLPASEMFPAVARIAELLRAPTHAEPMADGYWHFHADGEYVGWPVKVFAATTLVTDEPRAAGKAVG